MSLMNDAIAPELNEYTGEIETDPRDIADLRRLRAQIAHEARLVEGVAVRATWRGETFTGTFQGYDGGMWRVRLPGFTDVLCANSTDLEIL